MRVVDASVVIKMFLSEVGSDAASALLRASERLFVPGHCFAEVGEALTRKVRSAQIDLSQMERMLPVMHARFEVVPIADHIDNAISLALSRDVSVYDSLYVAVAMHEGCPLVSADRRLIARFAGTAFSASLLPL